MIPAHKTKWYKEAEKKYNADARMWNSLPGPKLKWPEDRFKITYCYCRGDDAKKELVRHSRYKIHKRCGYPLEGEYDEGEWGV